MPEGDCFLFAILRRLHEALSGAPARHFQRLAGHHIVWADECPLLGVTQSGHDWRAGQ